MSLSRRKFLGIAGATAALAACDGRKVPKRKPAPPQTPKGAKETWLATSCGGCPGGCGIRARVVAGRLVGVAGNPLHPESRGGLCPLGAASAQLLYHPDRVLTPLKRKGARGAGAFEPATWQQALSEIGDRVKSAREAGGGRAIAVVDGARGLAGDAAVRFAAGLGATHVSWRPFGDAQAPAAIRAMQGIDGPVSYDVANARFVLAFGPAWMEGPSAVGAARAFGLARRGRKGMRVRVAEVGPRLSGSAAHADEWVPLAPGGEAVLALGLLHMVLREGLEDRDFLDRHGANFDALRAIVLRDYHPDAVAERTGVPVATIVRLAREFASTRPAVAIGDDRPGPAAPDATARMAIHALNALVGAVNAPGGVLVPPPVPIERTLPAATEGDLSAWLADNQSGGVLLACRADPLGTAPSRLREEVARLPLVVSFSGFVDETARYADWVLPEPTWLERWEVEPGFTTGGQPVLSLRQPVLPPRGDVKPAPEALHALGRQLGLGEAVGHADAQKSARDAVQGLHAAGRGALFDVAEAAPWVEMLERGGWRASRFGTADEFWKDLVKKGGWWDPVYDHGELSRVLRTESGRFDFGPLAKALTAGPGDGRAPRPPEPIPPPDGFPLRLHLFPLPAAFGDSNAPLPFVQDALGRELDQRWNVWVELAPGDARKAGVRDGARVSVESPYGAVLARARVFEGVRPGVASLPMGPGGAPGGTFGRALDARTTDLLGPTADDRAAWVRVRRA